MSITTKVTVALNAMGQVAAASVHTGAQPEVTSGMVSDLGQTLIEIEVPTSVAAMRADEFLAHLAGHASVRAAAAIFTLAPSDAGQGVTSGSL